ncbi:MAG: biosynthetic-type acetolactate synthase large subunit [Clostridia bacterium]
MKNKVALQKEVLSGAEIILRALEAEGVRDIFGYPGGSVIPLYDAIYHNKKLNHILTRHEQGAIHAAAGYARATGEVGVCIATSGPGATNLVTGLADAFMDSTPIVAITGQVTNNLLGRDSFQEAHISGIVIPITKYSYLVKDIKDLARVIHEAFYIAKSGRPGPVLIDIPKDVTVQTAEFNYPPIIDLPGYQPVHLVSDTAIDQTIAAILAAERPLIFIGGGAVNAKAFREVAELRKLLSIPFTYSLMGKGLLSDYEEASLGMLGMHGTAYANYAMHETDLVIGLGVRFDDRVTGKLSEFAKHATVIHADIDGAEFNKNVQADIILHGDLKETLQILNKKLAKVTLPAWKSWKEHLAELKATHPLQCENDKYLTPAFILESINDLVEGEAFFTTEVGQNQMWAAQYLKCKYPNTFITSGGLGTMGYGLPSATGIQKAHPDKPVFLIAGDGSLQMNIQEMATLVQNKLPVNIILLNNYSLGMVKQWQNFFFDSRYSSTDMTGQPDFVKLAEAYGAVGKRIVTQAEVAPALREALNSDKVYLLDFQIDPGQNVYPMVPAGGTLNNMYLA